MSSKLEQIKPTQKRGGMRKPNRKRKVVRRMTPLEFFKQTKTRGMFTKRLTDHRFVIATDLEADDMAALVLFAAWVNVNVRAFEDRNNFPVYAIIIGETENINIKYKRATEFLYKLADDIGWNDPEHHLYKQYLSATKRIWYDAKSNQKWENEVKLTAQGNSRITECKEPEQDPLSDFEVLNVSDALNELTSVKPGNLFYLWLKPIHLELFTEHLDIICQSPAVIMNQDSNVDDETLQKYCKRQQVVYVDRKILDDQALDPNTARNLFTKLDSPEEDTYEELLNKVMFNWNDNFVDCKSNELIDRYPEFRNVDFEDYQEIERAYNKISSDRPTGVQQVIDTVRHDGKRLICGDQLAIVAMLLACGTLGNCPFKITQVENENRLMPTSNVKARQFLEAMLCAGIDILNE